MLNLQLSVIQFIKTNNTVSNIWHNTHQSMDLKNSQYCSTEEENVPHFVLMHSIQTHRAMITAPAVTVLLYSPQQHSADCPLENKGNTASTLLHGISIFCLFIYKSNQHQKKKKNHSIDKLLLTVKYDF